MADTQYELFRDLDRHCVAGGAQPGDCLEAVRRKRACIESAINQDNPLVREVLAGRTTFAAAYKGYSHAFRGLRRFLPMPYDDVQNERLEHLAKIVPNVRHFAHRSVFATDNPVTCAAYGVIASLAVAMVWTHVTSADREPANVEADLLVKLALGLGLVGFAAGLFSALKYRTRNPHRIHALEAAVYMDLNYNCHRTFDDEAWAKFIALKTTPTGGGPTGKSQPVPVAPPGPGTANHPAVP